MLVTGVVRPSSSPWASPVVIVTKKDGKPRFCIDYRRLNKVTRRDAYPLPRIDDILDNLRGSRYRSSIDLTSGYWQIPVAEVDIEKTAFVVNGRGLFEFLVMPFGLTNAPATFQRDMDKVFAAYLNRFVMVYLDDIIIYSKTFEEHVEHLRTVFQVLREVDGCTPRRRNVPF